MTKELTLSSILARVRQDGDCLVWTGNYGGGGMPVLNHRSVRRRIYERVYGPIPEGKQIGVHCFTDGCVHPDCLIARTKTAAMKGFRYNPASRQKSIAYNRAKAKLTMEIAREIRSSSETNAQIDRRLGLFRGHAGQIRRFETWVDHTNPFAGLLS